MRVAVKGEYSDGIGGSLYRLPGIMYCGRSEDLSGDRMNLPSVGARNTTGASTRMRIRFFIVPPQSGEENAFDGNHYSRRRVSGALRLYYR